MRKNQDNLHRDYIPKKVISHMRSSLTQGLIVLLRFNKVSNLTILQHLLKIVGIYKTKDIYFWLPYKNIVDASDKYNVKGANSRFPFAGSWFEVKEKTDIYKQGLNDFVFRRQQIAQHSHEIRSANTFLASELLTLTRKKVIKMLDDFAFKKQTATKKWACGPK